MVEINYISTTTIGQLFNFMNMITSSLIFVNTIFDINYRISNMSNFEDNLGIFSDIFSSIAAFVILYYSIITPFELIEVNQKSTEKFRTIMYAFSLHLASQSTVIDDPSIIFSTTYETIGTITNDTIFDSGNVSYIEATSLSFLKNINKYFIMFIYYSKMWLTISGIIYIIYVVRTNLPFFGKCRFFKYFFIRFPILLISIFSLYMYLITRDLESVIYRYSNILYEESYISRFLETISIIFLILKVVYMLLFWKHYELTLPAIVFVLLKAIDHQDELMNDKFDFDILVYLSIITLLMSIGSIILYIFTMKYKDILNFGPTIIYKIGIILVIISSFFLISAISSDWFDFNFEQGNISENAVLKVENAVQEMDFIIDDIFDVARSLDPCTKRKNIPDMIENTNITPINNENQVIEQLRLNRKKLADDISDIGSICFDTSTSNYNWDFNQTDTNEEIHCLKLKSEEDNMKQELTKSVNNEPNGLGKKYVKSSESDDFFVDEKCKNAQCAIFTTTSVTAIALSYIPFAGGPAMMAKMASNAAFTVFKIGRKIAKFAPRLYKKKQKIRKLANKIGQSVGTNKAAFGFSIGMVSIFLPVFIGTVISLSLIMFRRNIYVIKGSEISYKQLSKSTNNGLKIIVSIFLPLSFINAIFYTMLNILPIFMEAFLKLLPSSFLKVTFNNMPGFEALKLSYLIAFLGNLIIIISSILFIFNNSITSIFKYIKINIWDKPYEKQPSNLKLKDPKKAPFYWKIIDKLSNYNSLYLQPLIFTLPAIYIIYNSFINNKDYIKIGYKSSHETVEINDYIAETIANRERSEAINQDMDNNICGPIGKIIGAIVSKAMSKVSESMFQFVNLIDSVFDEAKEFLSLLEQLVDIPIIYLDLNLLDFMGEFLQNLLIYLIPIICSSIYIIAWIMSLIYIPSQNYLLYISTGIFSASVTNIIIHNIFYGIMNLMTEFKLPFINLVINMEDDYYLTQLCSMFNIASVIVTIINHLIPISNFKDKIEF